MRVTIDDVRKVGICVSGARGWWAARDLDFGEFVKHGIDAEVLVATGDCFALRVVSEKIRREFIGVDLAAVIITAEDVQASGRCVDGMRAFGEVNGFDFRTFVSNGATAADLIATGDIEANMVVRHKLDRCRG